MKKLQKGFLTLCILLTLFSALPFSACNDKAKERMNPTDLNSPEQEEVPLPEYGENKPSRHGNGTTIYLIFPQFHPPFPLEWEKRPDPVEQTPQEAH